MCEYSHFVYLFSQVKSGHNYYFFFLLFCFVFLRVNKSIRSAAQYKVKNEIIVWFVRVMMIKWIQEVFGECSLLLLLLLVFIIVVFCVVEWVYVSVNVVFDYRLLWGIERMRAICKSIWSKGCFVLLLFLLLVLFFIFRFI